MPSWQQLGENNIENLTQYVLSLSNLEHDEERAASGESTFLAACAACHTPSGTGNTALGAPNLTNDIWLYQAPGQSVADSIRQTLRNGRNGTCLPRRRISVRNASISSPLTCIACASTTSPVDRRLTQA